MNYIYQAYIYLAYMSFSTACLSLLYTSIPSCIEPLIGSFLELLDMSVNSAVCCSGFSWLQKEGEENEKKEKQSPLAQLLT